MHNPAKAELPASFGNCVIRASSRLMRYGL
jgi:hypothetical protein